MGNKFDEKVEAKSRSTRKGLLFFTFCIALASVVVGWGATPIKPISFNMKPMPSITWDERVGDEASPILQRGTLKGPASLAFKYFDEEEETTDQDQDPGAELYAKPRKGDFMFTGLANGSLIQVSLATGEVEEVLHTIGDDAKYLSNGWKCGHKYTSKPCGRSYGVAFDQDSIRLYVLDAWKGLYSVDLKEKAKVALSVEDHNGEPYNFLYGVAVSRHGGLVYFTESSTILKPTLLRAGVLEGASTGRLFVYDPVDGTVNLLTSKLYFPTGVTILENKEGTADEAVLIAETSRARIRRYNIPRKVKKSGNRAAKKGTMGTFAENLPGLPMSLNWNENRKEIIVGCEARNPIFDSLSRVPHARAFLATVQGWFYDMIQPRKAVVLRLDRKGKIQHGLRDVSSLTNGFVSAHVYKGSMYFGSDNLPYVAKLEKYNK